MILLGFEGEVGRLKVGLTQRTFEVKGPSARVIRVIRVIRAIQYDIYIYIYHRAYLSTDMNKTKRISCTFNIYLYASGSRTRHLYIYIHITLAILITLAGQQTL